MLACFPMRRNKNSARNSALQPQHQQKTSPPFQSSEVSMPRVCRFPKKNFPPHRRPSPRAHVFPHQSIAGPINGSPPVGPQLQRTIIVTPTSNRRRGTPAKIARPRFSRAQKCRARSRNQLLHLRITKKFLGINRDTAPSNHSKFVCAAITGPTKLSRDVRTARRLFSSGSRQVTTPTPPPVRSRAKVLDYGGTLAAGIPGTANSRHQRCRNGRGPEPPVFFFLKLVSRLRGQSIPRKRDARK